MINLINEKARFFVPDGARDALARTTDLCIAAHQDDIEVMAYAPIISCYGRKGRWFTGVTVTDGAGSPRSGLYADTTDEEMKHIRSEEQEMAAIVGRFGAQLQLAYPSGEVKAPGNEVLIHELRDIIMSCSPDTLYTHNLADKHDTHVAVVLNVIRALRLIPAEDRPKKVISMEVWRCLDWLCDQDKAVFGTSAHPNISAALIGLYDSQITGGKRYDLASAGRRLANATFFQSHGVDGEESISFGLDITGLVEKDIDPLEFICRYIDRFKSEVTGRIASLS
jgi:LmbE family N-acetylglucosaminyl deacetylase